MLKLLGATIKLGILSLIVLVLGNWLHWGGKSISDQIKTGMAHAEKTPWVSDAKDWASTLSEDVRNGLKKKSISGEAGLQVEEVTGSERQKLRALIKELNGNSRRD